MYLYSDECWHSIQSKVKLEVRIGAPSKPSIFLSYSWWQPTEAAAKREGRGWKDPLSTFIFINLKTQLLGSHIAAELARVNQHRVNIVNPHSAVASVFDARNL